ncbi:MAG: hypothetical protein M3R44_03515 [Candidatus Eremiobacteraeota bacterium]|nr:hypothetical protein [Candidatus Eremiobacteraeota bacterium]
MLAALVALFGPALARVPLATLQLVVGILLLFFGMRWLRKAVLRYAGAIPLHDESTIYERRRRALASATPHHTGIDPLGFATAFQAVALEGLEVIFIVIAVGASARALGAASVGAALAGFVVIGAGVALRAPLSRIPENALKLCVGILLSGFGTFWTGEGLRIPWPGNELSLIWLVAGFAASAALAYAFATRARSFRLPT